jgi:soluble lytic murein transglycosylase-like protein
MRKTKVFYIAILLLFATNAAAEEFCFDEAGAQYGINAKILRAIAKVESNFNPRAVNRNTNGTYDFGVMQINSSWGYSIGRDWWSTLGDPCTNIRAGAMILSSCMKKYGYTWEAVGCYNSQTPGKRDKYAMLVFKQWQQSERDDRLKVSATAQESPVTATGEQSDQTIISGRN